MVARPPLAQRWLLIALVGRLGSFTWAVETANALETLNADALPSLEDKILDRGSGKQLRIMEVLGQISDPRASVYLLKAYSQSPSPAVKMKIVESLGKMHDISLAPWFAAQIKSSDIGIRSYAIWALGELKLESWSPYLEALARRETGMVRISAIDALGKCGTAKQVPLLLEFIRDSETELRYVSVKALGQVGTPEIVPTLARMLPVEPDVEVQEAIATALGRAGGESGAKQLLKILTETDSPLVEHLAELGLEASGKAALPIVMPLMKDPDPTNRIAAAKVLAGIRSPEAVPALLEALKVNDQTLQLSALSALGECGTWDILPALSGAAQSNDRLLREAASDAVRKIAQRHEELFAGKAPRGPMEGLR